MVSIVSLHGMNMDPFEQLWLVIVSIESYSSDGGSLVMKSRAMHLNGCASGFIVMGNCGSLAHVVMFLRDWQRAHPFVTTLQGRLFDKSLGGAWAILGDDTKSYGL